MLEKIKNYFAGKLAIEYVLLAFLVAAVVLFAANVSKPETLVYLRKPITDMSIGEFLVWLFVAGATFSSRKRG